MSKHQRDKIAGVWKMVHDREAERDSCKAELKKCQDDNTSCEQQTTELQAKIDSLEQIFQEIDDVTTPSKDQQTQGSYLHSEENTIGMAGVHQENKEQADIVMP